MCNDGPYSGRKKSSKVLMKINKINIDFFSTIVNFYYIDIQFIMFKKVLAQITFFENLLSFNNSLPDINVDFLRFKTVDIHESKIWCFNGTSTIEELHSIVDSIKNVSVCVCFLCVLS